MKRLWQRIRYSLAARLLLLFLAMALAIGAVIDIAIGRLLSESFEQRIRPHLQQYVEYVIDDIGDPPSIERARVLSETLGIGIQIRGAAIGWSSRGALIDFEPHRRHRHELAKGAPVEAGFLDHQLVLRIQRNGSEILFFLATRPAAHIRWVGSTLILGAALLILLAGYWAIRRLFRPLQTIREGVNRIGAGELKHRIELQRRDELTELGDHINGMADEIEAMLEAKRGLLLAISHELRSPLARAKVALALLPEDAHTRRLQTEIGEMATLIDTLMEGEQLRGQHMVLQRSPAAIEALIRDLVAGLFPDQAIELGLGERETYLLLDAPRIRLLIKNLLDNALRFNRAELGPVQIEFRRSVTACELAVRDHGEGIAADQIEHLTEPFYRPDDSRQRASGGFGLGLYLCQMIARAHAWQLTIESEPGTGTVVRLRIPLSPNQPTVEPG